MLFGMDQVEKLIQERNLLSHRDQGILIVKAPQHSGTDVAKEILYRNVDNKTLLLLSGGRTPKELYTFFAKEEQLQSGAVGQIDERFGMPMHENSNQKMIGETGLLRYLQMRDIPFHPILKGRDRNMTAEEYDSVLRDLFSVYQRSIGLLGIGADGHTAGIPANSKIWKEFSLAQKEKTEYVLEYDDHGALYNERVTMSFLGLSMLDLLIVMVFGNDKKEALQQMMTKGGEDDTPARFYTRDNIAKKTVIITDQTI